MPEQHRTNINSQSVLVGAEMSYDQIAFNMAAFYLNKLNGSSKRRIDSFIRLSALGKYDSVIQIEACPFHSKSLPRKNVLLEQYKTDALLIEYEDLVSGLLRSRSVIGLSAVNPNAPISLTSVSRNAWLRWQANLISLDLETAKILPLTIKNGEPSSAFIYNDDPALKGLVLMKGSNNFPKLDSMGSIIDLLRELNSA